MSIFLIAALAYIILAYIALKYPHILHPIKPELKKPSKKFTKWFMVHRGGSAEKPENTLDAHVNSYKKGCDILELDIIPSKDSIPVVAHDNNLMRLAGKNLRITDLNFNELPNYLPSFTPHFLSETSTFSDKTYKFSALEEIFQNCPDVYINIDVKIATPEMIENLKKLIEKYNREELTIIGSSKHKLAESLRKAIPGAYTFMPMRKVLIVYLSYLVGLIGFIKITEDFMDVPIMTPEFINLKKQEMGKFRAFFYTAFVKFFVSISKPLNIHLRKRGIKVLYWTLNTEEEFDYAFSKECDGVITDKPALIPQYYEKHGYLAG
ncbi:GDPD1 [Blepharisma stoltei]|uniref:GP-PDE domain-containing protein n=1 Tax=Blepharisma stoltei TaxID=1481888 RepID=A0AAU9IZN7_9CILI|nr:unnamed protein product [Blepharisma stoltei]